MVQPVSYFSSGSSFNPSSYGTLWAWYKYNSLITLNGGAISSWGDSSGNGRTAVQATGANQPLNVSGAALFDGSNDSLRTATTETCPANYTVFTLLRTNNVGTIMGFLGTGSNVAMYFEVGYQLTYDLVTSHGNSLGNSFIQTTSNVVNPGSYIVLATRYTNGDVSADLYRNGVKQPVLATGSTTDSNASGTFKLGGTCNCEIVETIIYSTALTDANIATVSNYLLTVKNYNKVGTIYSNAFTNDGEYVMNWTANYSGNFHVSPNGLVVSNISGGQTGKTVLSYKTDLENWEITGSILVGTIDANSNGIGIGIDTIFGGLDFYSVLRLNTAQQGAVYHYNSQANFNNSGSNVITVNTGDTVYFSIIRDKDLYISRYWTNSTNFIILTKAMTYSSFNSTNGVSALSKPVIRSFGGTHILQNYVFKSTARKSPTYLFKGDSITEGLLMQYAGYRWMNKAITDINKFTVLGGAQEKTADMINSLDEIIAINPTNVILFGGINDKYASVPEATIVANMTTMVNTLTTAGINVIVCKLSPCNDYDVTSLNAAYVNAFGSKVAIDFYTLLVGSGTNINAAYSSDGLHPNSVCATVMATILNNAGIN